jgi:hypothetical protein
MKTNNYVPLLLSLLFLSCSSEKIKPDDVGKHGPFKEDFTIFSTKVKDSFTINVQIPDSSLADSTGRFPVIFVLDADLYFDIYASILQKYSAVGLLPPAILIGIGYNSFEKMDSLRQRDYTFPQGLPEYEMPVSGKADLFLNFIQSELIPAIDRKYPSDTAQRIIVGHSLGGYFTMYAFLQEIRQNSKYFTGFIAASPSLHFNNNYLVKQLDSLGSANASSNKLYVSFGGLEDAEMKASTTMTIDNLFQNLSSDFSRISGVKSKTVNFSELDHMDTQIPTFTKGLQWMMAQ